jgi:hypothetical protein
MEIEQHTFEWSMGYWKKLRKKLKNSWWSGSRCRPWVQAQDENTT